MTCMTNLDAKALTISSTPGARLRAMDSPSKLVVITDQAIANCKVSDTCPWSDTLRIGKVPFKFGISLTSQVGAIGRAFSTLVQIKRPDSSVAFEVFWSSSIAYTGQLDAAGYEILPADLYNLVPGPYNLYVSILSDDLAIDDEKTTSIYAVPEPDAEVRDQVSIMSGEWGDCVTLSTGDDGNPGFLQCAASHIGSHSLNSSTNGAISNLRACLSTKRAATIMGHGNPGLICTGNGNHCGGSSDDNISNGNAAAWLRLAATIKDKATSIRLAGCDVGDGQPGIDLLNRMAKATNATVSAPTGLLWCNAQRMWIDGVWRTATPMTPAVASAEAARVADTSLPAIIDVNGITTTIPRINIKIVSLTTVGDPLLASKVGDLKTFTDKVDFGKPLVTDALPAARITGQITVEFKLSETQSVTKKFNILSNILLHDESKPTYYYYVDTTLERDLNAIMH